MKFANVGGRACALDGSRIVDLQDASGGELPDDPMAYVIPRWQARARTFFKGAPEAGDREVVLRDFGPPVPRPGKILAVALNYRDHAAESGRDVPAEPAVFAKLTSSLTGPYDSIDVPDTCPMVDYEAEVVVVVGKTMRRVAAEDVWDHVAGVTAGQDISDRREQGRPPLSQFSLAKSYDTFSPIGPVMATLDEFADLGAIAVSGRISGREVQRGDTSQLIYSIPELLAWTCRYVTLEPGDLVFTGTPDGVGSRRVPPLYLADGMVLETEIPEVGTMRNDIRSVSAQPQRDSQPPLEVRP
jgi:2,4-diketo-3-deoxy-L-fuconate hydrolase